MTITDIIKKVSKEENIPLDIVRKSYIAFWKYIRKSIQELPLKEDLTEEEFSKLKTNFNIPSIGKLTCDYKRFLGVKHKFTTSKYESFKED